MFSCRKIIRLLEKNINSFTKPIQHYDIGKLNILKNPNFLEKNDILIPSSTGVFAGKNNYKLNLFPAIEKQFHPESFSESIEKSLKKSEESFDVYLPW